VLARRLTPLIGGLISQAQSPFIKTRCLHDNFLFVRNLARALHKKKLPALLLKLDFAKAFDSVCWEYLLELLQCLGFSARWRDWIMLLLSSVSSSILLNGAEGAAIGHRRGCGRATRCPLFSSLSWSSAPGARHQARPSITDAHQRRRSTDEPVR
jgi:hypothetical protein